MPGIVCHPLFGEMVVIVLWLQASHRLALDVQLPEKSRRNSDSTVLRSWNDGSYACGCNESINKQSHLSISMLRDLSEVGTRFREL